MKKIKEFNEFKMTPIEILNELTLELQDSGLKVNIGNNPKFDNKPTIVIEDVDQIYCKEYPENDMDWLFGKPIINELFEDLKAFGLEYDKDYRVYAGGLGVNIVFTPETLKRVKL
jgi:hypothetical protein